MIRMKQVYYINNKDSMTTPLRRDICKLFSEMSNYLYLRLEQDVWQQLSRHMISVHPNTKR